MESEKLAVFSIPLVTFNNGSHKANDLKERLTYVAGANGEYEIGFSGSFLKKSSLKNTINSLKKSNKSHCGVFFTVVKLFFYIYSDI